MVVTEDNEHGWLGNIVGDAVIQVCSIAGTLVGRGDKATSSLGEVSNQDPGQVHALVPTSVRFGVAPGRVGRVHREVSAIAISSSCRDKETGHI